MKTDRYCGLEWVFEHTRLLVADMVPFSNSSVIRLRAVTVSLVHTMGETRVARVIISTAPSHVWPGERRLDSKLRSMLQNLLSS